MGAEAAVAAEPDGAAAVPVTLFYLIKQVELASRARLDELTARLGITTLQYTAMTVLERHPGMISAQLARDSFVTAQSMAQMIDTLESRGLVERRRDPSSRRQMLISLTARGRQLLGEMCEPVRAIEETMTTGLDGDELAALRRALQACRLALAGPTPR